ncbi:nucleoside diphosphate kinase regulator [Aggregicoccus sp. 17bor-14]|uniref:nucleoside diphosphate kinase regulator n=1 Tax=Myxococcaceae TaxID=31 RepID=UPI00129D102F|nr:MULTISPECIES: nucleoside diphosphate kinase regulator [Myxococcaceae]MBF5044796.1 nucleoside diphosphate kinase regulator [Simulacricoccus sp. 17bor-14]MRI90540.1 nucleoside diphosphate kinase regulator [Aggregicoccus sp. 17bor-14]
MTSQRKMTVTEQDLQRLTRVLEQCEGGRFAQPAELLELELAEARVAASREVPPTLVTMNSSVVFEDEETGSRREVTLCYPRDAFEGGGTRVSVLAPVGGALLGRLVGERTALRVPGGRTRYVRVVAVPYQPEAAGDLHL